MRAVVKRAVVKQFELVVVGCSLGGMKALHTIFSALTDEFCVPIAIVQHRHKRSNEQLPEYFRRSTKLCVVDADDKQTIKPGCVYLAPANYHLLVEKGAFSLSVDDTVGFSRPSIDILFETAADAYRNRLIGIVLTGANSDGARGVRHIKRRGGFVVVQDPATAEAPAMPQAAIDTGRVDRILPLKGIGPFLLELCLPAAVSP